MGFILHSFRSDDYNKQYLDIFHYVKERGQKLIIVQPGYGDDEVDICIDAVLEDGIQFNFTEGLSGSVYLKTNEGHDMTVGGSSWDYVEGDVYRTSHFVLKLYTVDDFFKKELKEKYPEKEIIIEKVLDSISNPEKYFPYAYEYFKICSSWWKYTILYEIYKYGKYGQIASIDGFIDFLLSDLKAKEKELFLEKHYSQIVKDIESIAEPFNEKKNSVECASGLMRYHTVYLNALIKIELNNDYSGVNDLLKFVREETRDNRFGVAVGASCIEIVDLFIEKKFLDLIDCNKVLELLGVYLAIEDNKTDSLKEYREYTLYDGDTMEAEDYISYDYDSDLAREYVNKKASYDNKLANLVLSLTNR